MAESVISAAAGCLDDGAVRLRDYDWVDRYSSSRDDLVAAFYSPALRRSRAYDRAAGYFRSSVYSLVGREVLDLALRGGKIRLLCSPEMTAEDIAAVQHGLDMRVAVDRAAVRELARILDHPQSQTPVAVLANLVAAEVLDIRFAVTRGNVGVFHDKVGIFRDDSDALSFSGSINESWAGWHPMGNHESFEVFRSWQEPQRVAAHRQYFESLWNGDDVAVDIYNAPDAFRANLLKRAAPEPWHAIQTTARTTSPPRRRLLDHQRDALNCWTARGRRGILKHATGSGKTLTALNAIREWIAEAKPALVLVPSTLLLEQWAKEVALELSDLDPSTLLAGGGHGEWRRNGLLRLHTAQTGGPRIVIATMQTAATEAFRRGISDNTDILVVADEAHRIGAPENRKALVDGAAARLALSATPERAGDPEGTAVIFNYFGAVLEPVFTLGDAIDAGRLVPYVYHPSVVGLTDDEEADWVAQTEKIRKVYAQEAEAVTRGQPMSAYLQHLLIQRARIAKRAVSKLEAAVSIVEKDFEREQHWLLYCEDSTQLREVVARLRARGLPTLEYHSQMQGDRDATLDRFTRAGGVLVSIRCLDEGVDIPVISHALILASSRNYREFVQRRGRVLRTAEHKHHATLYDLLVLPNALSDTDAFDGLVFGEVARAAEFASDAVNQGASIFLKGVCIEYGLDPDQFLRLGLEADGDQAEASDGDR